MSHEFRGSYIFFPNPKLTKIADEALKNFAKELEKIKR